MDRRTSFRQRENANSALGGMSRMVGMFRLRTAAMSIWSMSLTFSEASGGGWTGAAEGAAWADDDDRDPEELAFSCCRMPRRTATVCPRDCFYFGHHTACFFTYITHWSHSGHFDMYLRRYLFGISNPWWRDSKCLLKSPPRFTLCLPRKMQCGNGHSWRGVSFSLSPG